MNEIVIEYVDGVKCKLADKIKLDTEYFVCFINIDDENDIYIRKYDKNNNELLLLTEEEFEKVIHLFRQRNAF